MYEFPTTEELDRLRAISEPHCVSMYVPFDGHDQRIEVKNLLREAKIALLDTHETRRYMRKTLRPVQELLDDREFWPSHRAGLAFFMSPKHFSYYHVPDGDLPYLITVQNRFSLDPLLKAMRNNRPYFVLALDHKNVRLFEGDRFKLEEVKLKGFPANMVETLRIDEFPKWREAHSIASARRGKASEAYHGQYNVAQVDKAMLEEFFRLVDRRLHFYLQSKGKPLILAGVDYLLPIYRRVNSYAFLWPKTITGSLKGWPVEKIRAKAWAMLEQPIATASARNR